MLGKGLESLIPKKNLSGDDGVLSDENGEVVEIEFDVPEDLRGENQELGGETAQQDFQRQEMEGEGVKEDHITGPVFQIEVGKIMANPFQPRTVFDEEALKELAASIREFGILQPLVVTKTEEETPNGTKITYQLIAGHRRLLAARMLGLSTVPTIVRKTQKKTEALELAVVENVQRENLNIIETARAYARLSDEFGFTQREIAQRLGKSREAIANALRLLSLPSQIQDAISEGKINESQARLLLPIDDPALQEQLFQEILRENLSVRDIRQRLEQRKKPTASEETQEPVRAQDLQMKEFEKQMSELFGAPVHIEFSRNGGKIVIHFYSPEEAQGIIQRIKPHGEQEY